MWEHAAPFMEDFINNLHLSGWLVHWKMVPNWLSIILCWSYGQKIDELWWGKVHVIGLMDSPHSKQCNHLGHGFTEQEAGIWKLVFPSTQRIRPLMGLLVYMIIEILPCNGCSLGNVNMTELSALWSYFDKSVLIIPYTLNFLSRNYQSCLF